MVQKVFDILPPEEAKVETPVKRYPPVKKISILFLFIFILVGALCYFKLPKAEIEIWPEHETLSFEELITASTEIYQTNFSERIIPARIFEIKEVGVNDFSSSGISEKEAKATGTIRVYNDYHHSQTLISKTRFQPPNDKVLYFRTTKRIVVPSKGYVDVEVIADKPGPDYNIEPTDFSIPGLAGYPQYTFVYGKSFEPMRGGVKEGVPIVLEEDVEKARDILTEGLFNEANRSLQTKISKDFVLFEETKKEKILTAIPSVNVGEEARYFNLNAEVQVKALLFKLSDLRNFAKSFILNQITEDKKLNEETLKVDFSLVSVNPELIDISLNLKFQALIFSEIDETFLIETLKGA